MSSTSGSDGSYTLTITFEVGTDLNTSWHLVQNLVNGALAQLPEVVQEQGVTVKKVTHRYPAGGQSLCAMTTASTRRFSPITASSICSTPWAVLPGVGQIRVVGAGPYSMRVWLDPNKLQYYNLTTLDVLNAVRQQNVQVVAGQLGGPPAPARSGLPVHHQRPGPAVGRGAVRKHHRPRHRGEAAQLVRIKDLARVELSQQILQQFCRSERP